MSDVDQLGTEGNTSASAIVRRAEELAARDWAAAIALVEAANREHRSDEIEIALARLRHRTFGSLRDQPTARQPVAPGTSPPVGPSGLAETSLPDVTAGHVRAALLQHGSLLVHGAIRRDEADSLAHAIDRAFAEQERGDTASAWYLPLEVKPDDAARLGRKWVRGGGGVLMADSPRVLNAVLELYSRLGLRSVVTEYLGSRPVLSANKCTLRRVSTRRNGDWHQDGAFLGRGIRAINLWLTLTPCGVDAPSLDVVPRRLDDIMPTGTGGANFDWAVGPEVAQHLAGDAGVTRPRFDAGDVLLFDDLFLHRTGADPAMTRDRHAVEMWCFAADAYPEGQVPLVW